MKKDLDYEKIKAKLIQRRQELINSNLNHTSFVDEISDVKDIGDEAYMVSSQKLQRSLGESEVNEIRLIDQALDRVANGGYGLCLDCGGEISEARLDYYPYAVRCIVCQEAASS